MRRPSKMRSIGRCSALSEVFADSGRPGPGKRATYIAQEFAPAITSCRCRVADFHALEYLILGMLGAFEVPVLALSLDEARAVRTIDSSGSAPSPTSQAGRSFTSRTATRKAPRRAPVSDSGCRSQPASSAWALAKRFAAMSAGSDWGCTARPQQRSSPRWWTRHFTHMNRIVQVGRKCGFLLALGMIACGQPSLGRQPQGGMSDMEPSWSEVRRGLRIGLELPPQTPTLGETLEATLTFRSDSDDPIRVYLLESDAFRSFQSRFTLRHRGTGDIVSVQPEPLPHGYVVSENDFPLIAPKTTRAFTQRLDLCADALEAGERYLIEWTYENEIETWLGGAKTLDGPTSELFDGERIPYIWTGTLSNTSAVAVARDDGE